MPHIKFDIDKYFLSAFEKCGGTSFWPPSFQIRNPLTFTVVVPVANVLVLSVCFPDFFYVLSFQKYNFMCLHGVLWVYHVWSLLSFLIIQSQGFPCPPALFFSFFLFFLTKCRKFSTTIPSAHSLLSFLMYFCLLLPPFVQGLCSIFFRSIFFSTVQTW